MTFSLLGEPEPNAPADLFRDRHAVALSQRKQRSPVRF
jgi:hypothetical protein